MTVAAQIGPMLAERQAKAEARAAERLERDAFLLAGFALLGARFDQMLRDALGHDSRVAITVTPVLQPVVGRSFLVLGVDTWQARATFNAAPQQVTFTPRLDFREPDQFGLIECALDFTSPPGRGADDRITRALLGSGIQLRGKTVADLLLPVDGRLRPLTAADLEAAFVAWWLRP